MSGATSELSIIRTASSDAKVPLIFDNAKIILILLVLASNFAEATGKEYTAEYWQHMGDSFANRESFQVALDCYNKSIDLDGSNASSWMKKGLALSGLKQYSDALIAYNESISRDPDLAEAWYKKGLALAHLGSYNESISAFDESIHLQPQVALSWYSKGIALANLGSFKESLLSLDEAIKRDDNLSGAWYSRALILSDLEKNNLTITQELIDDYFRQAREIVGKWGSGLEDLCPHRTGFLYRYYWQRYNRINKIKN